MDISEVKKFTPKAYEAILHFNEILSPGTKRMSEQTLQEIIDSPNSHLFFISEKEIIVGMLTVGIYTSPTGKKAWIEDVVIDTQRQGKGLGRILVNHAIDFAKEMDADQLMLTSNGKRIAANGLYQAVDFTKKETNIYQMKF